MQCHTSSCSDQNPWDHHWLLSFSHSPHPTGSTFKIYSESSHFSAPLLPRWVNHLPLEELWWPPNCSPWFCCPLALECILNTEIREILLKSKSDHVSPLLTTPWWRPVSPRVRASPYYGLKVPTQSGSSFYLRPRLLLFLLSPCVPASVPSPFSEVFSRICNTVRYIKKIHSACCLGSLPTS